LGSLTNFASAAAPRSLLLTTEAKIRKVEEIQGSNKEPQMVTTYIKIITKFEKKGKRIKIVRRKCLHEERLEHFSAAKE
jgi:hypothetical protein